MNFLSSQSVKRLDQYFKFLGQISNYKQFSYLSFFLNQKGDKLSYDPELNFSPLYRNPTHNSKYSLEQFMDSVIIPCLYSECFLTGLFNNHILTYKHTQHILKNCVYLDLEAKKDMANYMFGNRISYNLKNWIENFKNGKPDQFNLNFQSKDGKLPDQKRKNFFIILENQIRDFSQLESQIKQNDFFNIPNINKILCMDLQIQNLHRFNNELLKNESLFKEKNIKIKNLASDRVPENFEEKSLKLGFRIQKIFEYIYKNMKGNTLLHQMPQYYKFYNEVEKIEGSMTSTLHRFEPKETFLFLQRKRQLTEQNDEFTFEQLNKNFTYRFQKDPYYAQSEGGFQIVRYLSKANKIKNLRIIKMQQKGTINISMD